MTQLNNETRSIGPVTTAATGGVALSAVICWAVEEFAGVAVPSDIQGYAAILFCIAGGLLVPSASRGKYSA